MNLVEITIHEFPKDGAPWRIDGLGRLYGTGSTRSEPLIEVLLSKLKPTYEDPLANAWQMDISKCVQVKIGMIAVLKPGSVWINGKRSLPNKTFVRKLELTVNPNQTELCNWNSTLAFEGNQIELMSDRQFRIPNRNQDALHKSFVLVIRNPTDDKLFAVIPSSVIFQKCLSQSSAAVISLVNGRLENIVDNTGFVPLDTGGRGFYVELSKFVKTDHAYAYANLVADPVGRLEYERLRRSLVAQSINEDPTNPGQSIPYLKLGLPFSNAVSMQVIGKSMPLTGKDHIGRTRYAFLVTEIVSMSVDLLFDALIVRRKNDNQKGQNAKDPGLESAYPRVSPTLAGFEDEDNAEATSQQDADEELAKLWAEQLGGFSAPKLETIVDLKLIQRYKGKLLRAREKEFNKSATTGHATGNDSGVSPLEIEASELPEIPAIFNSFFETLAILRVAGLAVQTLVVSEKHRAHSNGNIANYFPKSIKRCRSWHLMLSQSNPRPRAYVIAEAQLRGTWHYLIEIERKEETGRSLAHIRRQDGAEIDRHQLRSFMSKVARENGWRAGQLFPSWIVKSIRHSQQNDAEKFSRTIGRAIGFVFGEGLGSGESAA